MKRSVASILLVCVIAFPVLAEEPVDLGMISRIKAEGIGRSQVMSLLSDLVDRHGPRLAGSAGFRGAAEWCRDTMAEWGLENAALEPWGMLGRSWELERFSAEMTAPFYLNLIAYPEAWTSGTDGVISGEPILIDASTVEDLEEYEGTLAGKIVLVGAARVPETSFEPDAKRYTDEGLEDIEKASLSGRGRGGRSSRRAEWRARRGMRRKMSEMFKEEGVACILKPSRGAHGTLFVTSGGSRDVEDDPALPSLVVAAEHYGLIARLLETEVAVTLEINVKAHMSEESVEDYNVVAEIPGTDPNLKHELVMLGGHLDSWHSSTGTTDNAAGCVIAMEAVRILKAIGVQPRRTIRVALWGAEEEGLLGSRNYVEQHFGDRDTMTLTNAHANFSAYFNMDNGVGRFRGIYCQSNDAVRPIFEAWLRPFHDMDATTVTVRNTGGTDHQSFDAVGLPGFQFIQDRIDYSTRTHHTNMDTYERAIASDLKQASVIMASFVYHAAMRDEKLPRKALPEPRRKPTPDPPAEEKLAAADEKADDSVAEATTSSVQAATASQTTTSEKADAPSADAPDAKASSANAPDTKAPDSDAPKADASGVVTAKGTDRTNP